VLSVAGAETWGVWLGYSASLAWLTVCAWHLGDAAIAEQYPAITREGYRLVLLTFLLIVANWPVRFAMQIDMLTMPVESHRRA
jgi:hypothetical protein